MTDSHIAGLRALRDAEDPVLRNYFRTGEQTFISRAPGRLDVMGGIADYSGSLVLQLPLNRITTVIAQRQPDPSIDVLSMRRDGSHRTISFGVHALIDTSPADLAAQFPADSPSHWAAYVLGVAHALFTPRPAKIRGLGFGARLLISSTVPEGKGVSSSAALEVATLAALCMTYDTGMDAGTIAEVCQWAENHIAGAPCGIMDQMTSAFGKRDHLLQLRCQPARIEYQPAIPEGYRFFGIDSGIRHAVTGADYGTVRAAAFMGYRMIAARAGLIAEKDGDRVRIEDPTWHGYLANISPDLYAEKFEHHLPVQVLGADFLAQFHGTTDMVTRVRPGVSYPVRQATAHPVNENARVEQFAYLIQVLRDARMHAEEMGELMYASHASYSACGLGSDGTDRLVEMVKDAGPSQGLFGAKITGGGSGGTVAIFADDSAEPIVRDIQRRYEDETGRKAELFSGSGPGMEELMLDPVIY